MYAGVGTFSITSLPCTAGVGGTHRTLCWIQVPSSPLASSFPKGIAVEPGRKAATDPRRTRDGLRRIGSRAGKHKRPSAGPEGGRLRVIGLAWGWGDSWGVGALPRTLVCTLASRRASKPLASKGLRRRPPPHWAKKKPPAGGPGA